MPADASAKRQRSKLTAQFVVKKAKLRKAKQRRRGKVRPVRSQPAPTAVSAHGTNVPRFGVFTHGSPYDGNVDSIETLQGKLDRKIDIVNWYQQWGGGEWISSVQAQVIKAVTDSGRTPLLTWEPWDPAAGADQPQFRLRAIAEGAHDAYIAGWADQLRDLGGEIYLRPMHEMNGTWYPWGAKVGDNTPELYRAAWQRMVSIFRDHGATNVKWVWCPLNSDTGGSKMELWYPGTDFVDVLSVDGYNWGSRHEDWGGWQSFEQVFGDAYSRLSKLGPQPIWIAEAGSAPQGGDKAKWVRDMWKTAAGWDRLDAVVWFDQDKEEDWSALPVASAFAA